MKRALLALPLSAAFLMAAGPAAANSGTIEFIGRINAGTCAIEIVEPGGGGIGNTVYLNDAIVGQFTTPNTEVNQRAFSMRITPGSGCTVTPGQKATVNFTSPDGPAGPNSDMYALRPYSNGAEGIAVIIRDKRDKTIVEHGNDSKEFDIHETLPTDMTFTAGYMASGVLADIRPGTAVAGVNFVVTLP